MNLYLVDTCVWRDFYENRISKTGNPIGKYANDFFTKIILRKEKIMFSEGLLVELNIAYSGQDVDDMLNFMIRCKILIKISPTKEEILEAKKLSIIRNIPFIDCLNAIQARDYKAILVTRDKHFFINLKDIVKVYTPEEII